MSDELSLRRRRLRLSMEVILAIEEELAARLDIDPETPLEDIYGSFTVDIVKGRFQRVAVASSVLLNVQQKRQSKRSIA